MRVTLEQWRMFKAVVDAGSYAQAEELIFKSHTSIYASVKRMEQLLGVRLFDIKVRKTCLTAEGEILLRRAEQLLFQAQRLEDMADAMTKGIMTELNLGITMALPDDILQETLVKMSKHFPQSNFHVHEMKPGKLLSHELSPMDFAILDHIPDSEVGEPIMEVEYCCVVGVEHRLAKLKREVEITDLKISRELTLSEVTGSGDPDIDCAGNGIEWQFGHLRTLLEYVARGSGFAWLPKHLIKQELQAGSIKTLAVTSGAIKTCPLYLVQHKGQRQDPVSKYFITTLLEQIEKLTPGNDQVG